MTAQRDAELRQLANTVARLQRQVSDLSERITPLERDLAVRKPTEYEQPVRDGTVPRKR